MIAFPVIDGSGTTTACLPSAVQTAQAKNASFIAGVMLHCSLKLNIIQMHPLLIHNDEEVPCTAIYYYRPTAHRSVKRR